MQARSTSCVPSAVGPDAALELNSPTSSSRWLQVFDYMQTHTLSLVQSFIQSVELFFTSFLPDMQLIFFRHRNRRKEEVKMLRHLRFLAASALHFFYVELLVHSWREVCTRLSERSMENVIPMCLLREGGKDATGLMYKNVENTIWICRNNTVLLLRLAFLRRILFSGWGVDKSLTKAGFSSFDLLKRYYYVWKYESCSPKKYALAATNTCNIHTNTICFMNLCYKF